MGKWNPDGLWELRASWTDGRMEGKDGKASCGELESTRRARRKRCEG